MKKYIDILKYNVAIAAVLLLATSCEMLDLAPHDRDTDLNYWKKPGAALYAVNKCYSGMNNADEVLFSDAMTDNAYTKSTNTHNQAIGNGSFSTAHSYVASVWDYRYAGIRECNLLLNNIQHVPELTDDLRNRYIAEATFIRVYHYFELYSKFGDIPYFTHVLSMSESKTIARTPKEEVLQNMLDDLSTIIDNNYLPTSYSSDKDTGRITRWAAMGLKARILLFEGRFSEVTPITNKIMTEGGFTLFGSYEGLFQIKNENNSEVMLDVQYLELDREHNIQYFFVPPSLGGHAQLSPLQELVDDYIALDGNHDPATPYGERDPRLKATIIYSGNFYIKPDGSKAEINCDKNAEEDGYLFSSSSTTTGYYIKKYWDNTYRAAHMSGLNIILMRYAEILLMHAEALAEQNQLDATEWNRTIYLLRQRAGFTNPNALDYPGAANLKEIVRRERRCELALEGFRHKDIVRWKIAENVMNGWCHGLYTGDAIGTDNGFVRVENRKFDAQKHYLWPIPQKDRDLNKNLTQNPNW